jgi:hypothetical protein
VESIPLLQRLPELRSVTYRESIPERSHDALKASLPQCRYVGFIWAP